jgi:hypothetical protein
LAVVVDPGRRREREREYTPRSIVNLGRIGRHCKFRGLLERWCGVSFEANPGKYGEVETGRGKIWKGMRRRRRRRRRRKERREQEASEVSHDITGNKKRWCRTT